MVATPLHCASKQQTHLGYPNDRLIRHGGQFLGRGRYDESHKADQKSSTRERLDGLMIRGVERRRQLLVVG